MKILLRRKCSHGYHLAASRHGLECSRFLAAGNSAIITKKDNACFTQLQFCIIFKISLLITSKIYRILIIPNSTRDSFLSTNPSLG